jgi:hypothetical protein
LSAMLLADIRRPLAIAGSASFHIAGRRGPLRIPCVSDVLFINY